MQAEADADPRNQYWVAAHLQYLPVLHTAYSIIEMGTIETRVLPVVG